MRFVIHAENPEEFLPRYISPNDIVADLGCGPGYYCKILCKLAKKVYCIDKDCIALSLAKESAPSATFLCESAEQTSLESDNVDIVILANSFHDMDKKEDVVKEIERVLKAGGRVIIVDWKKEQTPMGPPVWKRMTEEEYLQFFKGFTLLEKFTPSPYQYGMVLKK
ncbi:class I SAM-dependent methyltransferase [Stygiolobus caldivivus]|uniref:SAM-dependent methyltransferase n=1 Tax=Stygiolobus caldivivus TaxID=2824673 RepID=A0A8D5U7J8_9CREN|nr:class I SAM-dependent methyltransferase [Stygiolobus caldivivus]BCU71021.1 SAM-dependent methyltransferase [Stygiolobus caldivivus]